MVKLENTTDTQKQKTKKFNHKNAMSLTDFLNGGVRIEQTEGQSRRKQKKTQLHNPDRINPVPEVVEKDIFNVKEDFDLQKANLSASKDKLKEKQAEYHAQKATLVQIKSQLKDQEAILAQLLVNLEDAKNRPNVCDIAQRDYTSKLKKWEKAERDLTSKRTILENEQKNWEARQREKTRLESTIAEDRAKPGEITEQLNALPNLDQLQKDLTDKQTELAKLEQEKKGFTAQISKTKADLAKQSQEIKKIEKLTTLLSSPAYISNEDMKFIIGASQNDQGEKRSKAKNREIKSDVPNEKYLRTIREQVLKLCPGAELKEYDDPAMEAKGALEKLEKQLTEEIIREQGEIVKKVGVINHGFAKWHQESYDEQCSRPYIHLNIEKYKSTTFTNEETFSLSQAKSCIDKLDSLNAIKYIFASTQEAILRLEGKILINMAAQNYCNRIQTAYQARKAGMEEAKRALEGLTEKHLMEQDDFFLKTEKDLLVLICQARTKKEEQRDGINRLDFPTKNLEEIKKVKKGIDRSISDEEYIGNYVEDIHSEIENNCKLPIERREKTALMRNIDNFLLFDKQEIKKWDDLEYLEFINNIQGIKKEIQAAIDDLQRKYLEYQQSVKHYISIQQAGINRYTEERNQLNKEMAKIDKDEFLSRKQKEWDTINSTILGVKESGSTNPIQQEEEVRKLKDKIDHIKQDISTTPRKYEELKARKLAIEQKVLHNEQLVKNIDDLETTHTQKVEKYNEDLEKAIQYEEATGKEKEEALKKYKNMKNNNQVIEDDKQAIQKEIEIAKQASEETTMTIDELKKSHEESKKLVKNLEVEVSELRAEVGKYAKYVQKMALAIIEQSKNVSAELLALIDTNSGDTQNTLLDSALEIIIGFHKPFGELDETEQKLCRLTVPSLWNANQMTQDQTEALEQLVSYLKRDEVSKQLEYDKIKDFCRCFSEDIAHKMKDIRLLMQSGVYILQPSFVNVSWFNAYFNKKDSILNQELFNRIYDHLKTLQKSVEAFYNSSSGEIGQPYKKIRDTNEKLKHIRMQLSDGLL